MTMLQQNNFFLIIRQDVDPTTKVMVVYITSLTPRWLLQPFNRRCRIYAGFHYLLAHYVPLFKHVKDKI